MNISFIYTVLISNQKDEPDTDVIKELALFYGVSPTTMTSLVKEVNNYAFLYLIRLSLFKMVARVVNQDVINSVTRMLCYISK